MKTLFVAWQDPVSRSWYPIARLTYDGVDYQFVYTQGAREAQREGHFHALAPLDSLDRIYESKELFPIFRNRVPQPSRPDYDEFVSYLAVPRGEDDPLVLLARSGGRRATDSLEVFPCPEPDENGTYEMRFFAHGLRHLPEASIDRIERLHSTERLLLAHDFQNPYDPNALLLCTNDTREGDRFIVGFCPRYLLPDVFRLIDVADDIDHPPTVTVERVNLPPAPLQARLLCKLVGSWPEDGFRPLSSPMYCPIAEGAASTSCGD